MNSILVGVRPIPARNPPNRFAASSLDYLDELPGPEVELSVYEDHTKDILSENDSPDIGFRFSVNPVCAEYRNPVHIITKSPLIERDIEILQNLNAVASVGVSVSIPFWSEETARKLEPFVTTPARRMKAVQRLAAAGIPVTVNIAPLILGLGDRDVPSILEAAAAAGARGATLIPLRLPGSVKEVFTERLQAAFPLSAEKVLRRTREMRGGKLYDSRYGKRMQGEGQMLQAVQRLFETSCARLGLNRQEGHRQEPAPTFRRPTDKGGQLRLFER